MRRPWLWIVGGAVFAAVLGGAAWLYRRMQGASGDPDANAVSPDQLSDGATMSKVFHRERAAGVDPRIQTALDAWEANGPFSICVGYMGGVRSNATQMQLWQQGRDSDGNVVDPSQIVTNAQTSDNSAHGHAGAVDLWPAWDGTPHPNRETDDEKSYYDQMVAFFRSQGLVSGSHFPIGGGDWPHFEVSDWRTLPLADSGVS